MRYRVLGTTRALRPDGTPVPLGGARLRALLTVLALRPGRTVPVPLLVEEVWAGDPPDDAPGALQALVGRLRRALGPGAVESADGGYRLAYAGRPRRGAAPWRSRWAAPDAAVRGRRSRHQLDVKHGNLGAEW